MESTKGSEWRRWELHIHTPDTQKNDSFTGSSSEEKWEKYYQDISTYIGSGDDPLKAVAVIAITDYLSIDNYKKVILTMDHVKNKEIEGIEVINIIDFLLETTT